MFTLLNLTRQRAIGDATIDVFLHKSVNRVRRGDPDSWEPDVNHPDWLLPRKQWNTEMAVLLDGLGGKEDEESLDRRVRKRYHCYVRSYLEPSQNYLDPFFNSAQGNLQAMVPVELPRHKHFPPRSGFKSIRDINEVVCLKSLRSAIDEEWPTATFAFGGTVAETAPVTVYWTSKAGRRREVQFPVLSTALPVTHKSFQYLVQDCQSAATQCVTDFSPHDVGGIMHAIEQVMLPAIPKSFGFDFRSRVKAKLVNINVRLLINLSLSLTDGSTGLFCQKQQSV